MTRPRPANSDGDEVSDGDAPLPTLVTAQSNALRVYTVLPHGGTLALTAVDDNLAGTICSLDVVPGGTGGGSMCCCNKSARDEENCNDYLDSDYRHYSWVLWQNGILLFSFQGKSLLVFLDAIGVTLTSVDRAF